MEDPFKMLENIFNHKDIVNYVYNRGIVSLDEIKFVFGENASELVDNLLSLNIIKRLEKSFFINPMVESILYLATKIGECDCGNKY